MEDFFERYLNTNNIGLQYYYLLNIYKRETNNINILFLMLEYNIYLGNNLHFNNCISIINNRIDTNNVYYKYLLDKNNCIMNFNNIEYIKDIIKLNKLYNKDYFMFIENSEEKYKKTLNSDYLYLLGQNSYFNGDYRRALYYFNKYVEKGIISLREAYIYLFYITNCEEYLNKLCSLIMYNNVEPEVVKNILLKSKDKYINKEIIYLLHNIHKVEIKNKQKKLTFIC